MRGGPPAAGTAHSPPLPLPQQAGQGSYTHRPCRGRGLYLSSVRRPSQRKLLRHQLGKWQGCVRLACGQSARERGVGGMQRRERDGAPGGAGTAAPARQDDCVTPIRFFSFFFANQTARIKSPSNVDSPIHIPPSNVDSSPSNVDSVRCKRAPKRIHYHSSIGPPPRATQYP